MAVIPLRTSELPEFVKRSDQLGGPGQPDCERYWQNIEYRPDIVVDQSLDPFSEAYVGQQLALYREMSGRDFDQLSNEQTSLDVDTHVAAINPYNHGTPGILAQHIERLSRAIRYASPPLGGPMLDMGCGWGLSSEVAAYCGLAVTAVDVNKDFVDLVNRRAARFGHNITARHGTFDTFESDDRFAMILFYECFHHALRPWDLLARMARHLAPAGKIVMAGEPINDAWWKHWGLRLDPLSVYCIHKFGWLESGWSADFLKAAFRRARLTVEIISHPEGEIGPIVVGGRATIGSIGAAEIGRLWEHDGWMVEAEYMASKGDSRLRLQFPAESRVVSLGLQNFRTKPLHVAIGNGQKILVERDVEPGRTEIEIVVDQVQDGLVTLAAEIWVPDDEQGNGDKRKISIHLEKIVFY